MSAVEAKFTLELRHGLYEMVNRHRLGRAVRDAASAELARLGLPFVPTVSIGDGEGSRAVRLRLNGTLVPYPPELLTRVWQIVAPRGQPAPNFMARSGGYPDAWLQDALDAINEAERGPALMEALVALTLALVRRRPDLLLNTARAVEVYVSELETTVPEPMRRDVPWPAILGPLLRLNGTLADRPAVARAVLGAVELGLTDDDIVESAFAELRDRTMEVAWEPDVPDWRETAADRLKRDLLTWLGLPVPELRLASHPGSNPTRIEVCTAGVPGLPIAMIRTGELLVEREPESGTLPGVTATAIMHPLTGAAATVVPADERDELEVPGVQLVDADELAIQLLVRELSEHRGRLVTISDVEHQLELLRFVAPAVVGAALAMFPLGDLTRIVRLLVEDDVSMGDLKGSLDRLLDYEASRPRRPLALPEPPATETNGGGPSDPTVEDYAEAVRRERRHAVKTTADGAVQEIAVDPDLQRRLATMSRRSRDFERLAERIRDQAWSICANAPDGAWLVVVTGVPARCALRAALVDELPALAVRTDFELPLGAERREVGKIA